MQAFLLKHGGAALRREFWAIVKGEHPDAYMLRCLRAARLRLPGWIAAAARLGAVVSGT